MIACVDARRERTERAQWNLVLHARTPLPRGRIGRHHAELRPGRPGRTASRWIDARVVELEIADRSIDRETIEGMNLGLELGSLDVRIAGIRNDGAWQTDTILRTGTERKLHVGVIAEEHRSVDAHATLEQISLLSQFVGFQRLGIKRYGLSSRERTRRDATSLEARGELRVRHDPVRPRILQVRAVVDLTAVVV